MEWTICKETALLTSKLGMHYSNLSANLLIFYSKFYDWKGPATFFTQGEKAVWKNMAAWVYEEDEWVDLPGPANWWPDDIDSTGFFFSEKGGHYEAWQVVVAKELPADGSYERIFPAHDDLWLMDENTNTQNSLKAFLELKRF